MGQSRRRIYLKLDIHYFTNFVARTRRRLLDETCKTTIQHEVVKIREVASFNVFAYRQAVHTWGHPSSLIAAFTNGNAGLALKALHSTSTCLRESSDTKW